MKESERIRYEAMAKRMDNHEARIRTLEALVTKA